MNVRPGGRRPVGRVLLLAAALIAVGPRGSACAGLWVAASADSDSATAPGAVGLQGTLEGDLRWLQHVDLAQPDSRPASDLYVRRLELAVNGTLTDWAEAFFVLATEYLGDAESLGDGKMTLDEGHLNLRRDGVLPYAVIGIRTQPFGLFETHFATDPMTQDAYEVRRTGLTAGLGGPRDLDVSLTGYAGTEQLDHLFQSGLFDTSAIRRTPADVRNVESYIVSESVSALPEHLTLFGAYLSEPGAGHRNATLDVGFTFAAFHSGFIVDGEYVQAFARERYVGLPRAFLEGVLSATISYQFAPRLRRRLGGGNFRARRSHILSNPFEIAVRYEHFDDDGMSGEVGVWSVRDKYSIGGRYTFHQKGETTLYAQGEYRGTRLRVPPTLGAMSETNREIYLRFGMSF